jgi:hypothetical protein
MLLIVLALELGLPAAFAQTYFYDAAGRLAGVAYPSGNGIRYQLTPAIT